MMNNIKHNLQIILRITNDEMMYEAPFKHEWYLIVAHYALFALSTSSARVLPCPAVVSFYSVLLTWLPEDENRGVRLLGILIDGFD